ncbi:hypothetical protein [Geoanaerobacter pelophilus]|uniref:hypothetical protein n=1 Tax=Geoanaerobacter pelophilus TaxID=60036 RepID=UPI00117A3813|nr:hypothetical protein [Geoanaerobacter pelophilus]
MRSDSELIIGIVGTVLALMTYRIYRSEKRPMLTIEPALSPTSQSFFLMSNDNGKPSLLIQYLIKNTGSLIAKNVTIKSASVLITTNDQFRKNDTLENADRIFLNPGEERVICFKYKSELDTSEVCLPDFITLDLHLSYLSENNVRYSNQYKYKIFSDNAELLSSTSGC